MTKSITAFSSNRERYDSLFRDEKSDVIRAARSGGPGDLQSALEHGGDPAATDGDGHPVLLLAADREDGLPLVEILLAAGVKPDVCNSRGLTPLMAAARRNDAAMLGRLLAAGASSEVQDDSGQTAMDHVQRYAQSGKGRAGMKKLRTIALLVDAAARRRDDPRYEYQGFTALHWAAMADDERLMDGMLEFGADPFRPAKSGVTVMEKAFPNKAARAVMFRELAIQFKSDLERMRSAGLLNTSRLIDFFEKKGMKSPAGFTLWSLSEVQPVFDFLTAKDKEDRVAPMLGKRQINRLEQMATLATVNPAMAADLSERVRKGSELAVATDIAVLRLAGLSDDLILTALRRKSKAAPSGFAWRGDEVESLMRKFGLGFKRVVQDFLDDGAAEVVTPIVDHLRDTGMTNSRIVETLVERGLFPQSYSSRLNAWLHTHFGEPYFA
jgi:hypothetical protein